MMRWPSSENKALNALDCSAASIPAVEMMSLGMFWERIVRMTWWSVGDMRSVVGMMTVTSVVW